MASFSYKARSVSGELMTGEVTAESLGAAKAILVDQGLIPTLVRAQSLTFQLPQWLRLQRKGGVDELTFLTRQFSALFKAGVAMDRILATLARQTQNKRLKKALTEILEEVKGGSSLVEAFGRFPDYFDELYLSMLQVGEEGGLLDRTLRELVRVLKHEHRILAGVKKATFYPKIIVVVFALVFTAMMIFVIPVFKDFYAGFNAELPLPTQIMIKMSEIILTYWYFVFVGVSAFVLFSRWLINTKRGRLIWDRFKLKLPIFGILNSKVANARFGHLIGALYKNGIPLSRALQIVQRTIGNKVYQNNVAEVREMVEQGFNLSDAMDGKEAFSPLLVESAAVGEQAGSLDELLEDAASFYDEEIDEMLSKMTTLLEPMLMIVIFGLIGLMAMAIYLPVWNLTKVVLQ